MYFMDWAFIAYCLYVPFLIGVYILENMAIFKYRKNKAFSASFHRIFSVLSVVNIAACVFGTFVFRLPLYPIINRFYEGLTTYSPFLTAVYSGAYYLNCLSEFLGLFLAFNRFTTLYFPLSHDKFWGWFLPVGVLICIGTAFAPIWHLFDDTDMFVKVVDQRTEFAWYYLNAISTRPEISIWFNMVIVTLVCNIFSIILYGACLVRLCLFSVTRNYLIERNFFLVGFFTMIFSLPYMAAMLFIGLNLSVVGAVVDAEAVTFVAFQLPWLTDLKYLTPAPMLLITNRWIRNAIKRIIFRNKTGSIHSHSRVSGSQVPKSQVFHIVAHTITK